MTPQNCVMSRLDISPNLIHFTSDVSDEAAFQRLQKIVREKTLLAVAVSSREVSPVYAFPKPCGILSDGLRNEHYYSRYSLFGIMVSKKWLFAQGGRQSFISQIPNMTPCRKAIAGGTCFLRRERI